MIFLYPQNILFSGANFLCVAAAAKGVEGFDAEAAKKRFFEIYLLKVIEISYIYEYLLSKQISLGMLLL